MNSSLKGFHQFWKELIETSVQKSSNTEVQRSPSQVKGEGLKILSRRGSQVQILPAAPLSQPEALNFADALNHTSKKRKVLRKAINARPTTNHLTNQSEESPPIIENNGTETRDTL